MLQNPIITCCCDNDYDDDTSNKNPSNNPNQKKKMASSSSSLVLSLSSQQQLLQRQQHPQHPLPFTQQQLPCWIPQPGEELCRLTIYRFLAYFATCCKSSLDDR